MPAARPRMQVTPTQSSFLLLKELEKLTGKAPATMVRELLDEAAPALQMMLDAYRDLHTKPEQAQAAVMRMAAQGHALIAQATLDLDTDKKPGRKPGKKTGRGAANTG
uniref:Uncharacterized protein n=1 Tax=uncultured prokaryote TaxID=198431 RepID=A0A0H5PWC8_9ZZZZ|nr:hypothetical protein [uncultured prokaryote]